MSVCSRQQLRVVAAHGQFRVVAAHGDRASKQTSILRSITEQKSAYPHMSIVEQCTYLRPKRRRADIVRRLRLASRGPRRVFLRLTAGMVGFRVACNKFDTKRYVTCLDTIAEKNYQHSMLQVTKSTPRAKESLECLTTDPFAKKMVPARKPPRPQTCSGEIGVQDRISIKSTGGAVSLVPLQFRRSARRSCPRQPLPRCDLFSSLSPPPQRRLKARQSPR